MITLYRTTGEKIDFKNTELKRKFIDWANEKGNQYLESMGSERVTEDFISECLECVAGVFEKSEIHYHIHQLYHQLLQDA